MFLLCQDDKRRPGRKGAQPIHVVPTGQLLEHSEDGEGWRVDLEGQTENIQPKNKLTRPPTLKGTIPLGKRPGPESQKMSCIAGLETQSLGASPHSSTLHLT